MTLGWHVTAPLSAPTFEVAWSLDTALPRLGDPAGLDRSGDVAGFPHWTLASDDAQSLAVAYREGSAWAQTNHWFDPPDGALSWQPLWAPGGTTWPVGDYAGGTWRIGVSAQPADTAFADQLYAGLNA